MSDLWTHGSCTVCEWRAPIDQEGYLHTIRHCREHARATDHRTVLVFDPNTK